MCTLPPRVQRLRSGTPSAANSPDLVRHVSSRPTRIYYSLMPELSTFEPSSAPEGITASSAQQLGLSIHRAPVSLEALGTSSRRHTARTRLLYRRLLPRSRIASKIRARSSCSCYPDEFAEGANVQTAQGFVRLRRYSPCYCFGSAWVTAPGT
jgi:hypothetical protein